MIATSNVIELDYKIYCSFNYESLIASDIDQNDNALVLLLNALVKLGVKEVNLVGFDGFTRDSSMNYFSNSHNYVLEDESDKNFKISKQLKLIAKKIKIKFLTPTLYELEE